jgi:hypothetical protein
MQPILFRSLGQLEENSVPNTRFQANETEALGSTSDDLLRDIRTTEKEQMEEEATERKRQRQEDAVEEPPRKKGDRGGNFPRQKIALPTDGLEFVKTPAWDYLI